MHPLFEHRLTLLPYLGLWLVAAAGATGTASVVYDVQATSAALLAFPAAALGAFICLSSWYVIKAMPPQETPLLRFIGVMLAATVLSVSLWFGAVALWCSVVDSGGGRLLPFWIAAAPWLGAAGAAMYLFSVVVHAVLQALGAKREDEKRLHEAQLLVRDAELRALRAQLHPHFLFNSLNSVSALTSIDPEAARDMCLKLASYLRKTLAAGVDESISLDDEVALAGTYLSIEAVRFGERLRVETAVTPEAAHCVVPALILQPLVENAVMHGIARMLDGGTVRIATARSGDRIRITVSNPCEAAKDTGREGGHGLRIVRERLRARYGADASLTVAASGGVFEAEIILPCEEAVR
ncbi:MAG: histidine kinase [Ignavibacteria bacterium]|nr:histidine kinase [Ignavibacteria bacterium]